MKCYAVCTIVILAAFFVPALTIAAEDNIVRKPLIIDSVLIDRGKPAAQIVVPNIPEYNTLARRVQAAVKQASGAELPIKSDSDIASRRGEIKGEEPSITTILIGNQELSGLVTHLCLRYYCSVDTQYPGKGCYIIKTIHDPWGCGANVVLLTGSDFAGISKAVEKFCSDLPTGSTILIPRTFKAEFPKENKDLITDLSDAEIANQVKTTEKDYRNGVHGGLFNPIVRAGDAYNRTGRECYAKLFRDLVFLADRLYKESGGINGGSWGGGADFLFAGFVSAWDNVEESPSLTDADRARITRILLDFAHHWEKYGYVRGIEKPSLRTNHWTFDGQGFLAAGQYFGKYYNIPDAKKWLQMADWCFRLQVNSFKTQEDCGAYQWIALRHVCRYSTTRPDFTWFDSGKAKMAGDLGIMETDNLGYHVSFGDVSGFDPTSEMAVWQYLANITRDGRYVWALQKACRAVGSEIGGFACPIEPVEPKDLLGVKFMPTDPLFYAHFNGEKCALQERTFEKVVFRTSFDPDKPYMLLDGISGCYHGHMDGNSILRFTDKSRIWLADADYIKSQPKFHNSMLIFHNGQTTGLPTFCERELVADLDRTGISSTTTHGYAGADWRRNIIWLKDHAFVFIDEITANEPGSFSFRCYWQTLGEPELSGDLYRVKQQGPSLSIRNLDGARLRRSDDPAIGQNWKNYRYADPVVHVLQQIRARQLRAGESVCILNVLSTENDGQMPVQAQRVDDSSILLGTGADKTLIGLNADGKLIAFGIDTDARIYCLFQKSIALGSATRLSVGGKAMFTSSQPISIELNADGNAVIDAGTDAVVSIAVGPRGTTVDGGLLQAAEGIVNLDLPAGRHTISGLALPSKFITSFPEPTPALSMTSSASTAAAQPRMFGTPSQFIPSRGSEIKAMAVSGDTIYAGGINGRLQAFTSGIHVRWIFDAGSEIRAIWAGKLEKNQPDRIAVGTVKGDIFVLDDTGKLLWKQTIPYSHQDPVIAYLTSANLSGAGDKALIIGSENWHHYAFDAKGKELWGYDSTRASTVCAAGDLDGDGREEVLAGTEYYTWHAINPDGSSRWQFRPTGPRANAVIAGDITGSGKATAIFGGADSNIYAKSADGKTLWTYSAGDEVTSLCLLDADSDGISDVIAGSLSYDILALKGDGTLIWRRDLGEPILAMTTADINSDGSLEICAATEDGSVFALTRKGEIIAHWSTKCPVRKLATIPGSPTQLAAMCDNGRLVVLRML